MSFRLRRVVTGHDAQGQAKVEIDEEIGNLFSPRAGAEYREIWSTDILPANNDVFDDPTKEKTGKNIGTFVEGGSVFRVVKFEPGVAPRNHRTDSIDYGVVISGEIDMELDTETVSLKAGDVIVQRGTIHNWVNKGTVPCLVAFVLISAKPVTIDGKPLKASG